MNKIEEEWGSLNETIGQRRQRHVGGAVAVSPPNPRD